MCVILRVYLRLERFGVGVGAEDSYRACESSRFVQSVCLSREYETHAGPPSFPCIRWGSSG